MHLARFIQIVVGKKNPMCAWICKTHVVVGERFAVWVVFTHSPMPRLIDTRHVGYWVRAGVQPVLVIAQRDALFVLRSDDAAVPICVARGPVAFEVDGYDAHQNAPTKRPWHS